MNFSGGSGSGSSGTESVCQTYYNTQVEIFMALKDIHSSYTLSNSGELKSSPNIRNQQITVFWKPPGALQWLEKFKSEIVPGKSNLQFVSSLVIDFEEKDASCIGLKFEIRQLLTRKCSTPDTDRKDGMSLWSTTHTTLDRILSTGSKGLDMYLPIDFGFPDSKTLARQCRKVYPGNLFLRGEIIQPSTFGVLFQFGIQSDKLASDYFIELHKLNQDNAFELSHPYTLVYRSELEDSLPNYPTQNGKLIYFLESRLSNGDFDRVIKVDIFKKENFDRKGFALTTLGTLLRDQAQVLNVDRVDSFYPYRKKEMKVLMNLDRKIPVHPIEYYFRKGWKIVPVLAVDFSRSNWNEELHKRVLHDNTSGCRNPYEEALELCAESLCPIAAGHAVFYGFGYLSNAYMNAYRPGSQHVAAALQNYQEALCMNLMSSISISQERSPIDGATSSQSSTSSASASSPLFVGGGCLLAPLFSDLVALITARKDAYEYYTVIILTDGQYTDSSRYIGILRELSVLPVSLVFVGLGLGDFRLLLELEQAWTLPFNGIFLPRKFVHLIHFRCRGHWDSSLAFDKYLSNPIEIFSKEILTTVRDQALDYFRRYCNESISANK